METFLRTTIRPVYERIGIPAELRYMADQIISIAAIILIIFIVGKISYIVFEKILPRIILKRNSLWSESLVNTVFLRRASEIVPAITAYFVIPEILTYEGKLLAAAERIVLALISVISAHIAAGFLDIIQFVYQNGTKELSKRIPIKGYLQLIKIFLYIIGGILAITTIMNVSPLGILSGIGALSAVLMLIFKDLITGFVASMQLSSNDMIRIGDEIEMPKYNTNGKVIDITLQTVMVQNWDMTISTIPIYSFVSDSFRNWRGVENAPGQRIKRSLYIDMDSIHFLSPDEIETLSRIPLLSDHIRNKLNEIDSYNKKNAIPQADITLGRELTNLGVFRIYIEFYIKSLNIIAANMPFVVCQHQPVATGLPLELYFFCSDKSWINYERLQANIFDHLLAIIKEFKLRVYQNPSGADLRFVVNKLSIQPAGTPEKAL
ncbi:MAG: mechanosensitive ion channel family protein [Spirochaetaceae bacterium]|jgi:miniconductance mechanosensitive channel|nr:mechanosensitive ion channel family protein [Spirochaetaceae bacterium]